MHLSDSGSTPLSIVLTGQVAGTGVSLSSGAVTYGPYRGSVTALDGGTITMQVPAPGPTTLTATVSIDQQSGAVTGTVSGQ